MVSVYWFHCSDFHITSLRRFGPLFDVSHQMAEYTMHCLCFLMELPTPKKKMTSVRLINRYCVRWTKIPVLLSLCGTHVIAVQTNKNDIQTFPSRLQNIFYLAVRFLHLPSSTGFSGSPYFKQQCPKQQTSGYLPLFV